MGKLAKESVCFVTPQELSAQIVYRHILNYSLKLIDKFMLNFVRSNLPKRNKSLQVAWQRWLPVAYMVKVRTEDPEFMRLKLKPQP